MAWMVPLSVLDLSPITAGGSAGQSLRNSRDLAEHADRFGYKRFWMAEHHNMLGIASAATAVALAFVAENTTKIRIGSGGVMLSNHAPLVIAEQFGTLASLYPDRIDLGVGRAPGTDQATAQALRRTLAGNLDRFPNDVLELISYFRDAEPGQRIRAIPGAVTNVPVWILGSSTYGAQLAAMLGLPYAFASHFAPEQMAQACAIYRAQFRPSEFLDKPYLMLGLNVVAADTDAEAARLFTSIQQSFIRLRTGQPGQLSAPVENLAEQIDPSLRGMLDEVLARSVVGSPQTVALGMARFAQANGADELMITAQIYDHAARLRSFEIAAQSALSATAHQPVSLTT